MEENTTAMHPSMTDLIRMVVISPVVPACIEPTTLMAPEQNSTDAVRNPFAKFCVPVCPSAPPVAFPSLSPRASIRSSIFRR